MYFFVKVELIQSKQKSFFRYLKHYELLYEVTRIMSQYVYLSLDRSLAPTFRLIDAKIDWFTITGSDVHHWMTSIARFMESQWSKRNYV